MPRHPSVPQNLTEWIHLGVASTDTAQIAIVGAELAGILGDDLRSRYLDENGEPLPEPAETPEHELVEFEEIDVGDEGDSAVLLAVHCDGDYLVEGRFTDDGDGSAELAEVRIRLWVCGCTCHRGDPENTCEGDCHDEDPPGDNA